MMENAYVYLIQAPEDRVNYAIFDCLNSIGITGDRKRIKVDDGRFCCALSTSGLTLELSDIEKELLEGTGCLVRPYNQEEIVSLSGSSDERIAKFMEDSGIDINRMTAQEFVNLLRATSRPTNGNIEYVKYKNPAYAIS